MSAQPSLPHADSDKVGDEVITTLKAQGEAQANSDALNLLQDNTDGTVGVYIKRVNGAVIDAVNETFIFEPASAIKALHHVHAMLQVQAGNVNLTDPIPWFMDVLPPPPPNLGNGCPVDTSPGMAQLQVGLTAMMVPSDNRWTQAIRVLFGQANINNTAQTLGMIDTLTQQRIGCGCDIPGDLGAALNPNQLTLVDIGLLYEQVATGLLTPNNRQSFYALMLNETNSFYINNIIDQEAATLGLSAAQVMGFKSQVRMAHKGGSYGLNPLFCLGQEDNQLIKYRALSGWIELPSACGGEFVYGAFVDGAMDLDTQNTMTELNIFDVARELLRPQIRTALECQTNLKWYFGKQLPPFTEDNPRLANPIARITLNDQFASRVTDVRLLKGLLNPAGKDELIDPGRMDHLSCYSISDAPGQPLFFPGLIGEIQIETENFGEDTVKLGHALELCVSANKNGQFADIGDFKCYSARSPQRNFPSITLDDQFFADKPATIERLSRFCTPVGKNQPAPPENPEAFDHLACYDIGRDRLQPQINVNLTDQFIEGAVGHDITFTAEFERRFCEPARKISVQPRRDIPQSTE